MHTIRWFQVALATGALAGAVLLAGSAGADPALHATATLVDVSGNQVGSARFTEDGTGRLHVNVKVSGLTSGLHGIHIHAVGACTPTFAAAGLHHNPLGANHGSHAGDLPNLVVNGAGRGTLNAVIDSATLSPGGTSVFDADGSSLVIHAAADDGVTNPAGNSGARIACGVMVAG